MIRSVILSVILALSFSHQAMAGNNLKELKQSILKIALYMPEGDAVATAFAVSKDGENYIVTNNHVCDGFYKSKRVVLIPSDVFDEMPESKKDFESTDEVTDYYMNPGSDICVLKSKGMSKYKSLSLNDHAAEPTDDILIAGFVGRSMDLMYVQGKVYGTTPIEHPTELKSCLFDPPKAATSGSMTCTFFPEYPGYVNKRLQTAVNNIGPGFSGSPVLQDGKVSGIVCRYYVPAAGYSNGDVIFFPVEDIKTALDKASKSMVKVDSKQFVKWIKISEFDEEIRTFYRETEQGLKDLIPELLRKAHDE